MFSLLYPLLAIDPGETDFTRRGFPCSKPEIRERLEYIGRIFLHGYHAALRGHVQEKLAQQLDEIELEYRGFVYEGAAMALVLLDGITPWGERFSRFAAGAGKHHIYMLYVGAGWARGRLPWLRRRIESLTGKFHPVLSGLVTDGYGFHEGYFHWNSPLGSKTAPLSPAGRHIFHQGLGRSLWFVKGADAWEIAQTIACFAPQYHADAWSGIGLGCAYAGGMSRAEMEELGRLAAPHGTALAQGAAFAAKTRQLAGNPATHTELACNVFCGMNTETAAALCDETFSQLDSHHPCRYQQWRALLQDRLQAQAG